MKPIGAASPAADRPSPELIERFAAALARLGPQGGRIGLAVSGGPDSMAMLLLAQAAMPGAFEVATVDHGLRAEAKDECALVAAACMERHIACEVLPVRLAPGNVQEQARIARYAALGEWADRRELAAIATAHHADDQAETLLMRFNRGAGIGGLAGVREKRRLDQHRVLVIRPLLGFRRSELSAIVGAAGIDVAHDPGNRDAAFERVRMRQAMAEAPWLDIAALAQSAASLAAAEEALEAYADVLWADLARKTDGEIRLRPAAPGEILRRLVRRAILSFGRDLRGGDLTRLIDKLGQGAGGNVAGVLATVESGDWVFRREPPRGPR